MTDRLEFTTSEWELLESAPMMAGLLVGNLANSDQWLTELYAVFDAAEAMEATSSSLLIRAVTERMLAREGDRMDLPATLPKSPVEARNHLIAGCLQAARLVAQKAPQELDAFRSWLLLLARKSAESTREGGFLGMGGQRISTEEQIVLHELETALDLTR